MMEQDPAPDRDIDVNNMPGGALGDAYPDDGVTSTLPRFRKRIAYLVTGLCLFPLMAALLIAIGSPLPDAGSNTSNALPPATSTWITTSSSRPTTTRYMASTIAPPTPGPYPTVQPYQCTPSADWTDEQKNRWVTSSPLRADTARYASDRSNVVLLPSDIFKTQNTQYHEEYSSTNVNLVAHMSKPGHDGPLCQAVPVHIDYWYVKVTTDLTPITTTTTTRALIPTYEAPAIRELFDYVDVSKRVDFLDGRHEITISPPRPAVACEGIMLMVYTGLQIEDHELPTSIRSARSRELGVTGLPGYARMDPAGGNVMTMARSNLLFIGYRRPSSAC